MKYKHCCESCRILRIYVLALCCAQELGAMPVIPFKPVVETGGNAFLPATPLELAKNLENSVPFMTGITSEEGAIVAAREYYFCIFVSTKSISFFV